MKILLAFNNIKIFFIGLNLTKEIESVIVILPESLLILIYSNLYYNSNDQALLAQNEKKVSVQNISQELMNSTAKATSEKSTVNSEENFFEVGNSVTL